MRRGARIDDNQPSIVKALRAAGFSVQPLSAVGKGCPDLLVGASGKTFLLEVKNRDGNSPAQRALTEQQVEWHKAWRGHVVVVHTPDEALMALLPYV